MLMFTAKLNRPILILIEQIMAHALCLLITEQTTEFCKSQK